MLIFRIIQGPDKGRRFDLPDWEPQLIGRSSEALPISDLTCSRRHAELTPDETTFVIFRKRLREAHLDRRLFDEMLHQLDDRGLLIKEGTLVDATIIEQARGFKREDGDPVVIRPGSAVL